MEEIGSIQKEDEDKGIVKLKKNSRNKERKKEYAVRLLKVHKSIKKK